MAVGEEQPTPGDNPSDRPRQILCLGMSYADMDRLLKKGQDDELHMETEDTGSLESHITRVIECVRRKYLTEMDGRDLARVVATERVANAKLCTVSQEEGACYRDNQHLNGNFNRANFVRRLQEHFIYQGITEFDQVILDYFWIPAGWDMHHWSRTLFGNTLIEFARRDVLPYREPRQGELLGSVILPFCYHCFKEVLGNFKQLRRYYDVSFLRKHELDKVPLWKGTQQIGAKPMQYWLGKRRDQEEVYCTFGPRDVNEAGKDTTVPKSKILDLARQLEDFADIRFIVLTRMAPTAKGERKRKGQWLGLTPKQKVCRGFDSLGSGMRQAPPPPHHDDDEDSQMIVRASTPQNDQSNDTKMIIGDAPRPTEDNNSVTNISDASDTPDQPEEDADDNAKIAADVEEAKRDAEDLDHALDRLPLKKRRVLVGPLSTAPCPPRPSPSTVLETETVVTTASTSSSVASSVDSNDAIDLYCSMDTV